ncbi:hypothetical protein ACTNBL_00855 [Enterococcus villorum]|uniref:Phenylalanyl-tRNA synthetase subunit alpha n=2 Tax=Enterococcus villorum TaxID=112904 RepID=A0A511J1E2_9ENTE|nr:hypothetical protein [Enterococcus villorum]EOH91420.1 hypothetical protein UAO_00753 [Enterococcus villorum ATCC 700913]EOW76798.1 hypothetical protein I591_02106 [Enterococcus villorum ATCC 700913]GEL91836.1 phenylalanyl-tRNA synthetase subunit alpha [Enterococcus villorum]
MREYVKRIYFIEETQNIEGSYIEVKTLFVNEDKEKALSVFKKMSQKQLPSFGLILSEYKIKAEESYFYQLLKRWSQLPVDFYRTMTILNYQTLAETKM